MFVSCDGTVEIDVCTHFVTHKDKDYKEEDSFIDLQEFVVGLYVILTLWRARGANQPPYTLLHIGARRGPRLRTTPRETPQYIPVIKYKHLLT